MKEVKKEETNVISLDAFKADLKQKAGKIRNNNKITKIKAATTRTLEIMYSKSSTEKYGRETIHKGFEEMLGKKYEKIQGLKEHVCEILEFPCDWVDMLTVTGISLNYDYQNEFETAPLRGMVITMQKKNNGLNCPLNINTPFIKFGYYIDNCTNFEGGDEAAWSDEVYDLINEIIDDACMYMAGETKTVQTKLFPELETASI